MRTEEGMGVGTLCDRHPIMNNFAAVYSPDSVKQGGGDLNQVQRVSHSLVWTHDH